MMTTRNSVDSINTLYNNKAPNNPPIIINRKLLTLNLKLNTATNNTKT